MTSVGPPFVGTCSVAADKSLSHRALILPALAQGPSYVRNLLRAGDTGRTQSAMVALGLKIQSSTRHDGVHDGGANKGALTITHTGLHQASSAIDCGRSATTMRLLMGLLCGRDFQTRLEGDTQLLARPMQRVADVLAPLGAKITVAPDAVTLHPARLRPASIVLPVASAQLKSAVLLAAASRGVEVEIYEPGFSRDHTERLLRAMGADLHSVRNADGRGTHLHLRHSANLVGLDLSIPGDPSSAAFLAAASALRPGSDVTLQRVSSNPTRAGFFSVLQRMGANVSWAVTDDEDPIHRGDEGASDLRVRAGPLLATTIEPHEVPSLIDELPLFALLASQAEGISHVHGAEELRQKECDRLLCTAQILNALGADIVANDDGWTIRGPTPLNGTQVSAFRDHRLAMMLSIARVVTLGIITIDDDTVIADSFPEFQQALSTLRPVPNENSRSAPNENTPNENSPSTEARNAH